MPYPSDTELRSELPELLPKGVLLSKAAQEILILLTVESFETRRAEWEEERTIWIERDVFRRLRKSLVALDLPKLVEITGVDLLRAIFAKWCRAFPLCR